MDFATVMTLFTNIVTAGGGLWALIGVIIFGTALKDKSGPDMKAGAWQTIGGFLIITAAQMFGSIVIS